MPNTDKVPPRLTSEEVLRRMLNTPPKRHSDMVIKKKAKKHPKKTR